MGAKDALIGRLLGNAQKFNDEQIAQTIRLLIEHGVKREASDIHLEPHEQVVVVRYRIDGDLRGVHKLPGAALPALLAQLKEQAHLKPAVSNVPQEGQFKLTIGKHDVVIRLATLPVVGGEKAVLHLTPQRDQAQPLEALGFWGDGLQAIQSTLARPHGLVLVAGPKRAGKTATLYSLLELVSTPNLNSSTVEELIEHKLPGVNQTQVHPKAGITFAEGLQAVLKQDSNVIMVSNLPDQQATELAVHAATTGHLVLAGLHADSAAQALLQVRATGVQPFLLASAVRAAIGQRLVRKLCERCRERYELTDDERSAIEHAFALPTPTLRRRVHELEQQAAKEHVGSVGPASSTAAHLTHAWRAHPDGCEACDHSGYLGRISIVEVLIPTKPLRTLLLEHTTPAALEAAVRKTEFIPLHIDGLVKALRGLTTIEEVLRAIPYAA